MGGSDVLKLRQLEIFRAVVQCGTVTAAARALQMTQPAVTTALLRLEDTLGYRLFERKKGRIRPTEEAQALAREVDKIFRTVTVVEKFAYDLKDAREGMLSIACTPTLACSFVAQGISEFRNVRSDVRVWLDVT